MELVRHAVAEEMYVYPGIRRQLENGDEIAEHEISEHSEAEVTMKRIEKYKLKAAGVARPGVFDAQKVSA